MDIDQNTTVADLINIAADNPAFMGLKLNSLFMLMQNKKKKRADGLSDELTLADFYESWYMETIAKRNRQSPKTIAERATAMKYWKQITGDPKLVEISDDTIDVFLAGLYQAKRADGKTLSDQTIKKHLGAIESVLKYAGPKTGSEKRNLGLIPDVPEFPVIQKRADVNGRTPTMKEFERIIDACKVATRPVLNGITAPEWWECAYLFLYATGVRYGDFIGAKWDHIKKLNDVKVLVIPSENEKTHRERVVPLNSVALAALQRIPRKGRDAKIFQWEASDEATYKGIVKERRKIAKAAMLKPILATFHAIRRLTASMLDPAAAANVLGNNPNTCRFHYQTVAVAARAVEALPMPEKVKSWE